MSTTTLSPAPGGSQLDLDFAVVDVETTGLSPGDHRVLQIAVQQIDRTGASGEAWATLVDPDCDPGPVHIHGITRDRLRGAPAFAQVHATLTTMISGRVFVAHNAAFDAAFLAAELKRAGAAHVIDQRLCTMALARRLELDVPDHRLATLAEYYGVRQARPHDARDDVRVTAEVLARLMADA